MERAYRNGLYKRGYSQYERGNSTGQMAEMACVGRPATTKFFWFQADAGSPISERR